MRRLSLMHQATRFQPLLPTFRPRHLKSIWKADVEFEANFVTAPAEVNPGLGTHLQQYFGASTVIPGMVVGDHQKVDEKFVSMLFRLSLPKPADAMDGQPPIPVPGFGTQLNNRAIFGTAPRG